MTTLSSIEHKSRRIVLAWLVGFFATFIAVDIVMVTIALNTQPGVVTDHAYEKGLTYNETIKAANDQKKLGWTGVLSRDGNTLTFTLFDRTGTPIETAAVTGQLIRKTHAGLDQNILFTANGHGTYTALVSFPARGQWDIVVTANTDQGHYTHRDTWVIE